MRRVPLLSPLQQEEHEMEGLLVNACHALELSSVQSCSLFLWNTLISYLKQYLACLEPILIEPTAESIMPIPYYA